MAGKLHAIDRTLLRRRCVACGYDGALLRGGQAEQCARCGCDLRQRPARSYAEMEGLLGQPLRIGRPPAVERREHRLVQRWLAFGFLTLVSFLVLLWLASQVFAV